MVQEVRRIMFSDDELIAAYTGYAHITAGFLPEGSVIACKAETSSVRVTLALPNGSQIEHVVHEPHAVKPLIRFCLENNIMMPREGQKSLFCKDSCASLYIVYAPDAHANYGVNVVRQGLVPGDIQAAAQKS